MFVPVSHRRMREEGESLAHALTRELHEEIGLLITAAHAPRLVWVQTVAFPSTQAHGYAELGWKGKYYAGGIRAGDEDRPK
jgi:8-oxo-dGTP pyrophosphatase MutT (NUDIX family)